MFNIIRSIEKPYKFLKVDNDELRLVDSIEECSVFYRYDFGITFYLERTRGTFKDFNFVVSDLPSWLVSDYNKQVIAYKLTDYKDSL